LALVGGQLEELEIMKVHVLPFAIAKLAFAADSLADFERRGSDEGTGGGASPLIAPFSAPIPILYQDHPAIAQGPLS